MTEDAFPTDAVSAETVTEDDTTNRVREYFARLGTELNELRQRTTTYQTTQGNVTTQDAVITHGDGNKVCEYSPLLDVAGFNFTGPDGSRTFLLSRIVCGPIQRVGYPVGIVATPLTDTPVWLTATSELLPVNADGSGDILVRIYTWNPGGRHAPGIRFSFRIIVPGWIDQGEPVTTKGGNQAPE